MHLKRIKISIVVQKRESLLNDKRRKQAVYGLPYRDPLSTESAIALSTLEGNLDPPNGVDREMKQCPPRSIKVLLATIALKHFAEDDVTEANWLPAQGCMQQIGLGSNPTVKIVNPDG